MSSTTASVSTNDPLCHHRIWSNNKVTSKKEAAAAYYHLRCRRPKNGPPPSNSNTTRTHPTPTPQPQPKPPIRLELDSGTPTIPPLVIAAAHVAMQELVEFTLAQKLLLLPKVVAEFPNITVGGAIAGGGVESSSGRYGLFADTVAWVKVTGVMGTTQKEDDDGDDSVEDKVMTAYRGDELWCQLSCTFGANGMIILEAAIECVFLPSSWVHVSYHDFASTEQACHAMMRMLRNDNDKVDDDDGDAAIDGSLELLFVDGLQFPREYNSFTKHCNAVVMVGRIISTGNYSTSTSAMATQREDAGCLGWKRPRMGGSFYYEHVVDLVKRHVAYSTASHGCVGGISKNPNDEGGGDDSKMKTPFAEEVLDIVDYLFRYDAGAFWMARPMNFQWTDILSYFPFTLGMFAMSHRWVRSFFLTGWLFNSSSRLYRMLRFAPPSVIASKLILQDFYVPPAQAPKLLSFIRNNIPLSVPIWLCPVRYNQNQPFSPSYCDTTMNKDGKNSTIFLNCGVYGRLPNTRGQEYTRQLEETCIRLGGRKMLYGQSYYTLSQFCNVYGHSSLAEAVYRKTCDDALLQPIDCTTKQTWKEWIALWLL